MTRTGKIVIGIVVIAIIIIAAIWYFFSPQSIPGGGLIERIFPVSEETAETIIAVAPPKTEPTPEAATSIGTLAAKNLAVGSLILLSNDTVSSLATVGTTTRYHKNIAENLGHLFERAA